MADQPVWNPSDKDADVTLSNSDRTWSRAANAGAVTVRSTIGLNNGAWYVEEIVGAIGGTAQGRRGFATAASSLASAPGETSTSWALTDQAVLRANGSGSTDLGTNIAETETVSRWIDIDNGRIWYGRNGTVYSGNPAAGTGAHQTFTGGTTVYLASGAINSISGRSGTLTLLADYLNPTPSGFTAGWGSSGPTTFDQSLAATLTATPSIRKTVHKGIVAQVAATAALTAIRVYTRALTASLALSASIRKEVQKRVAATLDSAASIRKTVAKRLAATLDSAAFLARAFPVRLVATLSSSATMRKTISKILAATTALSASVQRIKVAIVQLSATISLSASIATIRLFYRTLTATVSLTASIRRTISKRLVATQPMLAKPLAWIAYLFSATRNDKPNWNQCPRCARKVRPNKLIQQMEYRGPRLVWTGLYVCHSCLDEPQPQGRWPRETGGDPKPVILARPRRD